MEDERKTYYVAVGAGQVLEDREAAAFEFEIRANADELDKLQEMFEETSSAEEEAILHFVLRPPTEGEEETNGNYDSQIHEIYKFIHQLGTEETKRHIEAAGILKKSDEHDCMEAPC